MATHNLNIQDQAAQAARLDIQNAIRAVAQSLSSSSAPTNNLADGMLWYDTGNNTLKIREGSSWVSIGEVDGSAFKANVGYASTAQAQNGTDTPLTMNPARVKEAIIENATSSIGFGQTWQAFMFLQQLVTEFSLQVGLIMMVTMSAVHLVLLCQ